MGTMPASYPTQQLIGGEQMMQRVFGDSVMMKQIEETHSPEGLDIDVRPLLLHVKHILDRAHLGEDTHEMSTQEAQDEPPQDFLAMLDKLSFIMEQIWRETEHRIVSSGEAIEYGILPTTEAHAATLAVCNIVSYFPWDAKLVLALGAFALNYGEYCLLAQVYTTNPMAKQMAILKQLPDIMEHLSQLQSHLDEINNLTKAMVELAGLMINAKELHSPYISRDFISFAHVRAVMPEAVYWTIRSIVACMTQITSLTTSAHHEHMASTTQAWELSTLADRLQKIKSYLTTELEECHKHIEKRETEKAYQNLKDLFEESQIDNMKILKALLCVKDDDPYVLSTGHSLDSIETLRNKNVLLLISGLNIPPYELQQLKNIHKSSRNADAKVPYELVWIPVVDCSINWNEAMEKQLEESRSFLQGYETKHVYSVKDPKQIEKHVIKFFREVWHLKHKPLLVLLDPRGKVVSPNAIHMMWIWGSRAFPFTSEREQELWNKERWCLKLLVDCVDQNVPDWIDEDKYIFLYGGKDTERDGNFRKQAKAAADAAKITLETVYMGTTKGDNFKELAKTDEEEKERTRPYSWPDIVQLWYFRARLESMLFSKVQVGQENDNPMRQIKKLLGYDKQGGWALLCKGNEVLVNGHLEMVTRALAEYDKWKEFAEHKGFDEALKEYHNKQLVGFTPPCCRIEFPSSTTGKMPERMTCPECACPMDELTTYWCCHDDPAD